MALRDDEYWAICRLSSTGRVNAIAVEKTQRAAWAEVTNEMFSKTRLRSIGWRCRKVRLTLVEEDAWIRDLSGATPSPASRD